MNPKSLENLIPGGKPWKKKYKKTVVVTARTSPEAKKGWEKLAQQHNLTHIPHFPHVVQKDT